MTFVPHHALSAFKPRIEYESASYHRTSCYCCSIPSCCTAATATSTSPQARRTHTAAAVLRFAAGALAAAPATAAAPACWRCLLLLSDTHGLAAATCGLGVLTLDTQAPVVTQTTMGPVQDRGAAGAQGRQSSEPQSNVHPLCSSDS